MTYAIFSIVAGDVSPSGCSAYTYAQYSYDPYIRGPFFQFSEQLLDDYTANGGTHPAFPFLTGHGGANQVVLYGYLGLRLLPDDTLHIDPNLPPQIPSVKYRTFYWRGWPIQAASNYTHTTIQRATTVAPLSTADQTYSNKSISVQVGQNTDNSTTYSLAVNGSVLVVANRQIGSINTVAGNIAQCKSVLSTDTYQPGQYPISAVDGAASTKWQPEFAANISSLTVDLTSSNASTVSGFYFDWAQAPPTNITIVLHNSSSTSLTSSSSSRGGSSSVSLNITISNPYDASSYNANIITLSSSNTTNYTFPAPVSKPRYATLFVQGNQALNETDRKAGNGTGATVAEWAVLS
jgi:hypothetical protein